MGSGPIYDRVSAALDAAHKACFKHPDRDVLGMSSGPFSGVNQALGTVYILEKQRSLVAEHLRFLADKCEPKVAQELLALARSCEGDLIEN